MTPKKRLRKEKLIFQDTSSFLSPPPAFFLFNNMEGLVQISEACIPKSLKLWLRINRAAGYGEGQESFAMESVPRGRQHFVVYKAFPQPLSALNIHFLLLLGQVPSPGNISLPDCLEFQISARVSKSMASLTIWFRRCPRETGDGGCSSDLRLPPGLCPGTLPNFSKLQFAFLFHPHL